MVIRVGIIGMGFMGRTHLEVFRRLPGVRVTAFAEKDPRIRAGRPGRKGNIDAGAAPLDPRSFDAVYADGLDLVEDPRVDLVDITLPTPLHCGLFLAAVAAGKHVLVEKPLARREEEVRAMLRAARRSRGIVMTAHCIRFWPAYAKLKEWADRGTLGRLRNLFLRRLGARARWSGWYRDAEETGGALYDLHVHDTDFVNHLLGRPRAVFSRATREGGPKGAVDHVVTQYLYPGREAPAVTALGAWIPQGSWPFVMGFTAVFEKGTLDFDPARADPGPLVLHRGNRARAVTVPPTDGWFEEIRYFVECVRRGREPERNSMADTGITMRIVRAEERSIRSGKEERV